MSMGTSRSWREISAEAVKKRRAEAQTGAQRRLDESAPNFMPGEPEPVQEHNEVEVGQNAFQSFLFTPGAQPNTHHVVVRLNTTRLWDLALKALTHIKERRTGPLEIAWVGVLEDITTAENADNADEEPDTVRRVD
jgi:hypothetical protein